jgi:hypothetical protein
VAGAQAAPVDRKGITAVATVDLDGGYLVVHLTLAERLGAMAKDLRIPLAAITGIRVVEDPWPELRGRRTQGTLVPGRVSLSVRQGQDGEDFIDFVVAHKGKPSVVIDLGGVPYDRLVLTCAFPDHVAVAVRARAPKLSE